MPRRLRTLRVVAMLSALLLAATACTGSDDDPDAGGTGLRSPVAERAVNLPPQIEEAWSTQTVTRSQRLATWTDDAVFVVVGTSDVAGFDLATGTESWRTSIPAGLRVCEASAALNDAGVGGMLLSGKGSRCATAAALDTRTGGLLWTRPLGRQSRSYGEFTVSVGEQTLAATLTCGEVRRVDLASGRELPAPLRQDRKCSHASSHDGTYLATWNDPETADTPDDLGTGFIPPCDSVGAFELYDQDTGELLWRRVVDARGTDLERIVADDPVLLETTVKGHRLLQAYDDRGRPSYVVGKEISSSGDLTVIGVEDGVLVAGYGTSLVHAYDTSTGTELWSHPLASQTYPVGIVDDALVLGRAVGGDGDGAGTWLTRLDLRTGEEQMLGVIAQSVTAGTVSSAGDRLVVLGDTTAHAYDLPAPFDTAVADFLPTYPDLDETQHDLAWTDDDVRPEDAREVCEDVSTTTLQTLGLRRTDLPAPADCSWAEYEEPSYATRTLTVDVTVASPDAYEKLSAVDQAEQAVDDLLGADSVDDSLAGARPVPGLFDEAMLAVTGTPDGDSSTASLVVRDGNVVVRVSGSQVAEVVDRLGDIVARHQLEQGVLAAAGDVLGSLGPAPSSPAASPAVDPGTYTALRPMCPLLARAGARLVPQTARIELRPSAATDERAGGCGWYAGDYQPELTVHAYAVPGSVTGDDAEAVAQEMFEQARGTSKVTGLGDEAVVDAFDFEGGRSRTRYLTARQGNLLVTVEYERWGRPAGDRMRADAVRLARRVLAADT